MTILAAVADRHTVVIWADTLLTSYGTRQPSGEVCKLAANGLALAVGVGRGWHELIGQADAALLRATGLDEAVPAVRAVLRRSAARLAPRLERLARFSFAGCGYAIAGWSREAGHMVVWDLDACSNFEPALAGQVAAPAIDWPHVTPPRLADVPRLAAQQVRALLAQGHDVGRLTVATITRHGITVLPPSEIVPASHAADNGAQPAPDAVGLPGAGAAQPIHQAT